MNPSGYGDNHRNIRGEIDFNVVSESWEMIRRNMVTVIVTSLIFVVAIGITYAIFFPLIFAPMIAAMQNENTAAFSTFALLLNPFYWLLLLILSVVPTIAMGCFTRIGFSDLRGESPTVGDGFKVLGEGLGTLIIYSLMLAAANLLSNIPCIGIFISLAIYTFAFLAIPAIVEGKMAAMDAIRYSIQNTSKFFWMILGLWIVCAILTVLGACACGVGLLITAPFCTFASVLVYWKLQAFGLTPTSPTNYPRDPNAMGGGMPAAPETPRDFSWPDVTSGATMGGAAATMESAIDTPPAIPTIEEPAPSQEESGSATPDTWPETAPPVSDSTLQWPSEQMPTEPVSWPDAVIPETTFDPTSSPDASLDEPPKSE